MKTTSTKSERPEAHASEMRMKAAEPAPKPAPKPESARLLLATDPKQFAERILDSNLENRSNFDPLGGALNTAIVDLRVATRALEHGDEDQVVRQDIISLLIRVVERVEAVREQLHQQRFSDAE